MIVDLSDFSTGVCDRLRQLTFCAVIAQFRNESILEIYELPSLGNPFSLSDLFYVEDFTIVKVKSVPNKTFKMHPINSSVMQSTVDLWMPKDINISKKEFYLQWVKIYKKLKPKRSEIYLSEWNKINLINKNTIGIHIRLTDRLSSYPVNGAITKSQFEAFVKKKLPAIISYVNTNNYTIFLASDNSKADEVVRNILKSKVNMIEYNKNWNTCGDRETESEPFLLDLFGLARTREIFSTTGGGVPLTANMIGGNKNVIHIWTEERIRDKIFIRIRLLLDVIGISKYFARLYNIVPRLKH